MMKDSLSSGTMVLANGADGHVAANGDVIIGDGPAVNSSVKKSAPVDAATKADVVDPYAGMTREEKTAAIIQEQVAASIRGGVLADNYLRCDSSGSCMMGDRLATKDNFKMNVGIDGVGNFGMKTADNFLRCDSAGNC
jgi:hypothetical protein